MTIRSAAALAGSIALAGLLAVSFSTAADALTAKECSAKYQAAKTAGSLGGKTWNQFRKTECAEAEAAPAAAPATAPAAPAPAAAKPAPAAAKPATTATGPAVFPNAVDPKYKSESAGKARMHTCLDQYKANKATNGNAGLKWIEKGGGYYSECNKHLGSG
jgi:hypothetical protein